MIRSPIGREWPVSLGSQTPFCPVDTGGIPSPARLQLLSASGHMLTWYRPRAAALEGFQGRGQYDPQLGEELTGHEGNSREAEGEERE